MAVAIDTSALGMAVEVSQIGRELKQFWTAESSTSSRASLINFAVFCTGIDALSANTELINEFTRRHACRALLVCYEPDSSEDRVSAWINAHCHLSRAGKKQVCCEQVSFLFEGNTRNRIASTLFANLDSDLPLYLWWQCDFPEKIESSIWAWVDRLIYDSQCWANPREQLARLRSSIEGSQSRLVLCDLNWARSLHLRQALAQMFDYPENRTVLDQLATIEIAHAAGYRSTAVLLFGWFVAQLGLGIEKATDTGFACRHADGNPVEVTIREEAGRSISHCELRSKDGVVSVQRDAQGDFFRVNVRLPDCNHEHLLPAGSNATTDLLLEEISSGGRHRVYLKALNAVEGLL